jgi:hypothetical protein
MLKQRRKSRATLPKLCRITPETYSPHGLRRLAGGTLAEAGATMDEVIAILGHLTEDERPTGGEGLDPS